MSLIYISPVTNHFLQVSYCFVTYVHTFSRCSYEVRAHSWCTRPSPVSRLTEACWRSRHVSSSAGMNTPHWRTICSSMSSNTSLSAAWHWLWMNSSTHPPRSGRVALYNAVPGHLQAQWCSCRLTLYMLNFSEGTKIHGYILCHFSTLTWHR